MNSLISFSTRSYAMSSEALEFLTELKGQAGNVVDARPTIGVLVPDELEAIGSGAAEEE